jgi:hypothetical protein
MIDASDSRAANRICGRTSLFVCSTALSLIKAVADAVTTSLTPQSSRSSQSMPAKSDAQPASMTMTKAVPRMLAPSTRARRELRRRALARHEENLAGFKWCLCESALYRKLRRQGSSLFSVGEEKLAARSTTSRLRRCRLAHALPNNRSAGPVLERRARRSRPTNFV